MALPSLLPWEKLPGGLMRVNPQLQWFALIRPASAGHLLPREKGRHHSFPQQLAVALHLYRHQFAQMLSRTLCLGRSSSGEIIESLADGFALQRLA